MRANTTHKLIDTAVRDASNVKLFSDIFGDLMRGREKRGTNEKKNGVRARNQNGTQVNFGRGREGERKNFKEERDGDC